jgi:hypothetical protein
MDAYQHGLVPDKKESSHRIQNSKVRSIVDGAAINLLIPRNVQMLFKAYKNGLALDYTNTV